MRALWEGGRLGPMLRIFGDWRTGEIAYVKLGWDLCANIEFPSEWHEQRRTWIRLGLGVLKIGFSFPWRWTVPDHGQCSGPRYGFAFFGNALWLYYGKDHGTREHKRYTAIYLPWSWDHVRHDYLNEDGSVSARSGPNDYSGPADTKSEHSFRYTRRSGEVQQRTATINGEEREWRWRWFKWLPWPRMIQRTIHVDFSDEVGEGTGSWKGGVVGCSHDWKHGESQEQALRRMERDVKFPR